MSSDQQSHGGGGGGGGGGGAKGAGDQGAQRVAAFHAFRTRLNERVLSDDHARSAGLTPSTLNTKRFFTLDGACYKPGALDAKTKELLGLVASMVLRCDDCISYHIDQCVKAGCSDEELWECFDVALIVGGSIVIPHLRRGVDFLDALRRGG
jgi:AhpD family alkylhydroperoxidase